MSVCASRAFKVGIYFQISFLPGRETLPQTHDKTAAQSGITRLWQGLFQRTIVLTSCVHRVPSAHTHTHIHTYMHTPLKSIDYFSLLHSEEIFTWQDSPKRNLLSDTICKSIRDWNQIIQIHVRRIILEKEYFFLKAPKAIGNTIIIVTPLKKKHFFMEIFKHIPKNGIIKEWDNVAPCTHKTASTMIKLWSILFHLPSLLHPILYPCIRLKQSRYDFICNNSVYLRTL